MLRTCGDGDYVGLGKAREEASTDAVERVGVGRHDDVGVAKVRRDNYRAPICTVLYGKLVKFRKVSAISGKNHVT